MTGPNSPAASTGEGFDELAVAKLGAECGDLPGHGSVRDHEDEPPS
jgi:hypothetical protein